MVKQDHSFFFETLPKKKKYRATRRTFDPIHNGHLRISMLALTHFCLDEVWWIISLANL